MNNTRGDKSAYVKEKVEWIQQQQALVQCQKDQGPVTALYH